MFIGKQKKQAFNHDLEKLEGWKSGVLSFPGRTTLIKLDSTCIDILSFKIPASIFDKMNSNKLCTFSRVDSKEKKSWNYSSRPKKVNGTGLEGYLIGTALISINWDRTSQVTKISFEFQFS